MTLCAWLSLKLLTDVSDVVHQHEACLKGKKGKTAIKHQ